MSQLPHILYPSPGDKESYCLGCRKFASSKSAQEEWEKVTRHLEMTNRGREFIGGEFARLLQDWYQPTEGLAPAEVQVYGGDARLVIGKVLEEFALMQAKYKLLTNHSPLLENDNSSKTVPGYDPGHTLGTGDQEPHKPAWISPKGEQSLFSDPENGCGLPVVFGFLHEPHEGLAGGIEDGMVLVLFGGRQRLIVIGHNTRHRHLAVECSNLFEHLLPFCG
ncbi:hypothetical protein DSO57_1032471 [Entomophthora muscae]|uniref:Uncharacterized protein n=1 Tax=Entomophthora muscae TaxID=34485 RepID=A0ACC2TYX4_9FUNG|nr:hypothetical protein DSO57_1032471 [Entomophthora muscae]